MEENGTNLFFLSLQNKDNNLIIEKKEETRRNLKIMLTDQFILLLYNILV